MPFSDCEYYPCELVALDSFLTYSGYDTPLLIHKEWHFRYTRLDNRPHIEFNRTSLEERLKQSGIRIARRHHPDVEFAWSRVSQILNAGHPVAILADTLILEQHYYPGRGHHSGHYIILAGIEDGGESVCVIDPSWIVRFKGKMPISSLKSAWQSQAISGCNWVETLLPAAPGIIGSEDVCDVITENCEFMGKFASDGIGIAGLYHLLTEIELLQSMDQETASEFLGHLYESVKTGVAERDGHGRYLNLVSKQTDTSELLRLGEHFKDLTNQWIIFRNLCLRGQKRAQKDMASRLQKRLARILEMENEAFAMMTELLSRRQGILNIANQKMIGFNWWLTIPGLGSNLVDVSIAIHDRASEGLGRVPSGVFLC